MFGAEITLPSRMIAKRLVDVLGRHAGELLAPAAVEAGCSTDRLVGLLVEFLRGVDQLVAA